MRKGLPLAVQMAQLDRKIANKLVDADNLPFWRLLLGEGVRPKRESGGTVMYSSEVPDIPANMMEASQRHYHLADWLQQGHTYEEFIRRFGPET